MLTIKMYRRLTSLVLLVASMLPPGALSQSEKPSMGDMLKVLPQCAVRDVQPVRDDRQADLLFRLTASSEPTAKASVR
jgi:hypothetical protein